MVGDPADARVQALAAAAGVLVQNRASMLQMRGRVVHLIGDSKSLFSGVLRSGLAAGVVVSPCGPLAGGIPRLDALLHVAPLPWWTRRVHRFVLASQDEARALHRSGVALGRIVVVRPGEEGEIRGVYGEVGRVFGG